MPLNLSIKKANNSIIKSYLYSVHKEILRHMILKQEEESIKKGWIDKSNYYALNMDNANKDKLIAYYLLIKNCRCVDDETRANLTTKI